MTETPTAAVTAEAVREVSRLAGLPLPEDVARRIAVALTPALGRFAELDGTLPFEAEPAVFLVAQKTEATR